MYLLSIIPYQEERSTLTTGQTQVSGRFSLRGHPNSVSIRAVVPWENLPMRSRGVSIGMGGRRCAQVPLSFTWIAMRGGGQVRGPSGEHSGPTQRNKQASAPLPSHSSSSLALRLAAAHTPSSFHLPFYSQTTILLPKINRGEARDDKVEKL